MKVGGTESWRKGGVEGGRQNRDRKWLEHVNEGTKREDRTLFSSTAINNKSVYDPNYDSSSSANNTVHSACDHTLPIHLYFSSHIVWTYKALNPHPHWSMLALQHNYVTVVTKEILRKTSAVNIYELLVYYRECCCNTVPNHRCSSHHIEINWTSD